ncbi:deoxyribose-phosphate aldolase [bacterium]|nr:deoxyribose-phosphate aldolase [bacterium]
MRDPKPTASRVIALMDLTSLNEDDTEQDVIDLCRAAHSRAGDTAAVCIFPRFIPVARRTLHAQGTDNIKIATVTNFPGGGENIETAIAETRAAVAHGADEIDLVFPYRALLRGDAPVGEQTIAACREICSDPVKLKVIIESGELGTSALIRTASEICIGAGADFIKTSTGKVAVNATLEAADVMLRAIRECNPAVGLKVAGGIKTIEVARQYLNLAADIMGDDWVTRDHFRFGASSLLGNLLAEPGLAEPTESATGY